MKKIVLFFLIFNCSFAQNRLDKATIEEYLKIQQEFSKTLCTPGTEIKYQELLKEYQGEGIYLPSTLDEKVDLKTIKVSLPLFDEKINWIKSQIEVLKLRENFKELKKLVSETHHLENDILDLKQKYYLEKDEKKKQELINSAKEILLKITANIALIKHDAPFLLSFKFPLNHTELRAEYEKIKDTTDKELRVKANQIFFYRKIVQDGLLDEDSLKSDNYLRAAFDTFYLSINKENRRPEEYFLTENERVDLKYLTKNFQQALNVKPEKLLKRFEAWKTRTEKFKDFYSSVIDNKKFKISENSELKEVKVLLEERARALYNLKEFSLTKQAATYEFWAKQSELYQSLFVLDTILYSEIGRIDENVGFFRQDVTQVVLNRIDNSRFNQLGANDSILKYINKDIKTKDHPWLNTLFKEGEFSFTYFYIPGNLQIYCPDESRIGKFLRKENLNIAMKLLNNPRTDFKGVRYFSRVSMLGRISMDSIWKDYTPVGEEPGTLITKGKTKLVDHYKNGKFRYLYEFKDSKDIVYKVVEINGTSYVINSLSPEKIYTYRNPHLFKFFSYTK